MKAIREKNTEIRGIIPRDADKREGDFLKVFPPKTSFLKEIRLFSSSPENFAPKIAFISLNESSVAHRGAVFEKTRFLLEIPDF